MQPTQLCMCMYENSAASLTLVLEPAKKVVRLTTWPRADLRRGTESDHGRSHESLDAIGFASIASMYARWN